MCHGRVGDCTPTAPAQVTKRPRRPSAEPAAWVDSRTGRAAERIRAGVALHGEAAS